LKRDPDFFAERTLVHLYIARKLSEALAVEKELADAGLDYCVEADEYHGGFLFRTTRTGAFFYVAAEDEERAAQALEAAGRKPLAKELRTHH
jgi:hypothetical protein